MTTGASQDAGRAVAVVDGVDVDAVAAAVRRCPAVSGLIGAELADFATYLPGRRIPGLRVSDELVEVAVCAHWGIPLLEVAAQVRQALAPLAGVRRIDVTVADLEEPPAGNVGPGGERQ